MKHREKNDHRFTAFIVCFFTCFVVYILALAQNSVGYNCENYKQKFDIDKVVKILPIRKLDMILDTFGIYAEPCDGGLYLVDVNLQKRLARINESWWLEAFESAAWKDKASASELVVTASYITGIGPTGTRPFRARIVLQKTRHGWTAGEPVFLEDEPAAGPETAPASPDSAPRQEGSK